MGCYLAKPVTTKEREDGVGPGGLRFGACSMQGWRLCQEDAHLALPDFDTDLGLGLFGVFDGHCGGVVSVLAAQWLPEKIRKAKSFKSGDYPAALTEAFLALDRHFDSQAGRRTVAEEAIKLRTRLAPCFLVEGAEAEGLNLPDALEDICADNPDAMGSTAVVALLEYGKNGARSRLHVANCGDSRAVLWDKDGHAIAMSKDHKPTHKLERARVEAAGGWVTAEGRIEGNLNLSRAIADFEYKRTRKSGSPEKQMISGVPDVKTRVLQDTDRFLLLGCDGVWETRRNSQETVDAARRHVPRSKRGALSISVGRLLSDTLAPDESSGLGMDNMTSVLVELPRLPIAIQKVVTKKAAGKGVAAKRSGKVVLPVRRKAEKRQSSRSAVRGVRSNIQKRPSARR